MMLFNDSYAIERSTRENEETFSDRVLMVLQQQKRSKSWLADEIGMSKQALNYILMHSSKKKCVNEIASALNVNPEWLKTGKGNVVIHLQTRDDIRFIPIVSVETLTTNRREQNSTLAVTATYSAECFAVVLHNDSMEPLFTQGSILIIDPNKKPKNRDFVLFSLPGSDTIYFRQFFKEGKDYYFKAAASMYDTIKQRDVVLYGTLLESRHKF